MGTPKLPRRILGVCRFCDGRVDQFEGYVSAEGRCQHFHCHNRYLDQAFLTLDVAQLVLEAEEVIKGSPDLERFYRGLLRSPSHRAWLSPGGWLEVLEALMSHASCTEDQRRQLAEISHRTRQLALSQN